MFILVALMFVVVVAFESVELSPTPPAALCTKPSVITCDAIVQRFFYSPSSKSCQSTACSACPQGHFFSAAQAVRCCTTGDVTACNPTLVGDPCATLVQPIPPQQETFGFDPATNQAVVTAASTCPLSTGRYYANLSDCQNATQLCPK